MKKLAAILAIGLSFAPPVHAADWSCAAPGLVSGNYDGGDSAYIHLSGFSGGSVYAVVKTKGNRVNGTTSNGTKFSCVKK